MKKNRPSFSVPGLSLLLLIFVALCLITFSLLSLSGASADASLSERAACRTKEYYEASNTANRMLEEIDAYLAGYLIQAQTADDPEAAYFDSCQNLPDRIPDSSLLENRFSFSVPVTDGQLLQIILELAYPVSPDDACFRITSWKIVNTAGWNPDTTQNLFTFE